MKECIKLNEYMNYSNEELSKLTNKEPIAMYVLARRVLVGKNIEKDYDKAFNLFKKSAKLGYTKSKYHLGLCYEKGIGTNQDYNKAIKWYTKAANNNHIDAQYSLGFCYEHAMELSSYQKNDNDKKAEYWYEKAASNGHIIAQDSLGVLYDNRGEYKKAIKWFKKAANKGNCYSQESLGFCYEKGKGVKKNYKKAFYWYEKAAQQNLSLANYHIATLYERGLGVKKDYDAAIENYEKTIKKSDIPRELALCCEKKAIETKSENYITKTLYYLNKKAEQGDEFSQSYLGKIYFEGKIVKQNYKKAAEWMLTAANNGNFYAQNIIGTYYKKGIGVEKNLDKATYWYNKSANQGYYYGEIKFKVPFGKIHWKNNHYKKAIKQFEPQANLNNIHAQYNLALCYKRKFESSSTPQKEDAKKSIYWYTKAANQGDLLSQQDLSMIYYLGIIIRKNDKKAAYWFTKAADQGDLNSIYMLGIMHENGYGVEKNVETAIKFYEDAASKNNAQAIYRLGEIYLKGKITNKNLLKAKQYFLQYKKIEDDYYLDFYLNKIEEELKKEKNKHEI